MTTGNPRIPFRLADARPATATPLDRPLMVHLVINVEVWAFDTPMPRQVLPAPHDKQPVPDVPNFAWAEYGLRCGLPRVLAELARRGLTGSCALNAAVQDLTSVADIMALKAELAARPAGPLAGRA